MELETLLRRAVTENASDIFIVAGIPVSFRKSGLVSRMDGPRLLPPDTEELLRQIYALADDRDMRILDDGGDDDFSFSIPGLSRFRVNAYKQRGALSAVIRVITFQLPDPKELGIPEAVMCLGDERKGMVLVTGARGKRQVHHPGLHH